MTNSLSDTLLYFLRTVRGQMRIDDAFEITADLKAEANVVPCALDAVETLSELTLNAMQSISGIYEDAPRIVREWKPKERGKIHYTTADNEYSSYLTITDNGQGINPVVIYARAKEKGRDARYFYSTILQPEFSTKGTPGNGLSNSDNWVRSLDGQLWLMSSSYLQDGTITQIFCDSTGRYIRNSSPNIQTGATFRIDIPNKLLQEFL